MVEVFRFWVVQHVHVERFGRVEAVASRGTSVLRTMVWIKQSSSLDNNNRLSSLLNSDDFE